MSVYDGSWRQQNYIAGAMTLIYVLLWTWVKVGYFGMEYDHIARSLAFLAKKNFGKCVHVILCIMFLPSVYFPRHQDRCS